MNKVVLGHGSGGRLTQKLVKDIFLPHVSNDYLKQADDAAVVWVGSRNVVFSTDVFTVRPVVFPGGDIGKLAVCGLINDLVVMGATPKYLSAAFVIEEGFSLTGLEAVMQSFGQECRNAAVEMVAADTKVVERGKGDDIYIAVSGIGEARSELNLGEARVTCGDTVIVTGDIGDHGAAIVLARDELQFDADIQSDCACLAGLVERVVQEFPTSIKWMRDATRGGVATVINELASRTNLEIMVWERTLPIKPAVVGLCEILGLNPLYLANEGKIVMVVDGNYAEGVVAMLRGHPLGRQAAVIGSVVGSESGRVYLETVTGGTRLLDMLVEDQLPRIC